MVMVVEAAVEAADRAGFYALTVLGMVAAAVVQAVVVACLAQAGKEVVAHLDFLLSILMAYN